MDIHVTNSSGNRRLSTRYTIADAEHERKDHDGVVLWPAFEISTSHHKDRKAFLVTHSRILVGPRFVRWAMSLRNEDPIPALQGGYWVPVPRFSQKELERVHAEAVATFEGLSSQERRDIYLWATRAKG